MRDNGRGPRLLRRAATARADGEVASIDPASAGWEYLTFHAYRLHALQAIRRPPDHQERLVIVLEGAARIVVGDRDLGTLGSRASVFDGPPPPLVLVEPGLDLEVVAAADSLVAIAAGPGGSIHRTAVVAPGDVLVEHRGHGLAARRVHHLLPPSADAGRLIAFEVFTPGGHWSSYPPHKHDTESPPIEARLEEIYFFRFAKPQGFAFTRIYTADRSLDEALVPMDGDLVAVPRGYHTVGVAAGYDGYYLNVMAGPSRAWQFTVDPDHAWLMDWNPAEPGIDLAEA